MIRTLLLVCCLCYAWGMSPNPLFDAAPQVATHAGRVVGKLINVLDHEVAAFLGIPYAKPPLEDRRFKVPEPVEPWQGTLLTNRKPAPCMQISTLNYSFVPTAESTEDCLYLNVWTPVRNSSSSEPLPVMVWIYGGAFSSGSSELDLYDGGVLSSYGQVVVVSMNYRVGIFGFMDMGDEEAPGNVGLHDQISAMKWVKENVHHFGGDPNRVTLFGSSAGALSISLHLASPLSKGLFHRAIIQSGSAYHPDFFDSPTFASIKTSVVAELVGCECENITLETEPEIVFDCVKNTDPVTLSQTEFGISSKMVFWFMPSYPNEFLPLSPIEAFDEGNHTQVDVLIGGLKDEGSLFLNFLLADKFPLHQQPDITVDQIKPILRILLRLSNEEDVETIHDFYFGNIPEDSKEIVKTVSYVFGNYVFNCAMMYLAEKMDNAHMYHISHRSQKSRVAEWVGATHYDEVPYVFGVPLRDSNNYSAEDAKFSEELMKRWVSFAYNGSLGEAEDSWPKFTRSNPATFELNPNSSRPIQFPYKRDCEFLRPYFVAY
ncbi:acetylcholinesterase-1 [Caerostris darwini]|uniref:Carboxylic ester hydrolase n=1 Tax=Caerostris darwini TaxID=1538125 RepID=A0AAV4P6T5_9ARAC|nr:acetylcholinesterase-1 [Caerostris darwini]